MNNTDMWALILGFLLPPVISVVNQPGWSKQLKVVMMVAFCVAVGLINVLVTGELTGKSATTAVMIVMVSAITFYRGVWKPTGISPKIEESTSPKSSSPQV